MATHTPYRFQNKNEAGSWEDSTITPERYATYAEASEALHLVPLGRMTRIFPRRILEIASDIRRAWPSPYFGAVPYIEAMMCLNEVTDTYGQDDATDILMRFLSNAAHFRGPVAGELKDEIRLILNLKQKGKKS